MAKPCEGVRIRYTDLMEVVKTELNALIDLSNKEAEKITRAAVLQATSENTQNARQNKLKRSKERLEAIDKILTKLYYDNAEGKLSDERLDSLVEKIQSEAAQLNATIQELDIAGETEAEDEEEKLRYFFELAKQYTHIETLDRDVLVAFIDRIIVGPKSFPEGHIKATRAGVPYKQRVRIVYKFIGDINNVPAGKLDI